MTILLVRLRQIGDVVFTTPVITALHRHLPDARISYLVEPAAAAVVAHHPHLHEVIVAPRGGGWRGLRDDLRLGRALRARRFEIAIDLHGGPRASLLTWLSGSRRRIGYNIPGRAWMYTDVVARARDLRPRHSVANQADLLQPLGVPPPRPDVTPVVMDEGPSARAAIAARLRHHGAADDPLIVMHVSAGNPFRRWPLPAFADVAATLVSADPRRRVIVTSGPSETDAANQVVRDAGARLGLLGTRVMAWSHDLPLDQLRALVDRAALYIGGDSGPMHIAATTAVPMVSLYGPTLPARSAPWRPSPERALAVEVEGLACRPCDQRACITHDYRCLALITPAAVVEAAERLLRNG
mgnify:CR=1 FL=1